MTAAAETLPGSVWSPLRTSSAFRYLFAGQLVSLLGDQFLVVGLPLILLHGNGGAAALGKVLAAYGAARVIALPLGGVISDRVSRRLIMLTCDAIRGALVLALALGVGSGHPSVAFVAAIVAGVSLAEGVFLPSSYAIIPLTVPESSLSRANALSGSAQNLAVLVGPGLGGLLAVAVTPRACLFVDAASYAVSAGSLCLMRLRHDAAAEQEETGRFFPFLRRTRLLQVMVVCTLLSNLAYFGMLEVGLPVLSVGRLDAGGAGFGAALAAFGLGSLVGSLMIVRLDTRHRRGLVAIGLGIAQGLLFIFVVPVVEGNGGIAAVAILLCAAGMTNGVLNAFYLSRIQEAIPTKLLGRAMSVLILAVFAVHPISVAAAAALCHAAGPLPVFTAAGASIVAAFVFGSFTRSYRDL